MKKLAPFILPMLIGIGALSVSPVVMAKSASDQSQKAALKQIFNRLSKSALVRANFNQQKTLPNTTKRFVSSGRIVFDRSQGVLWQIGSPVKADLIMTNKTLVQKTANTQSKINLTQNQHAQVAKVFMELMAGNEKTLEKNFDVTELQHTADSWQVTLTPKSQSFKKLFSSMTLGGDDVIKSMSIIDAAQGKTHITLSNHRTTPAKLSDGEMGLFNLAK